jgi:hypothetical protein
MQVERRNSKEVGHRCAGDEQTTGVRRKMKNLFAPMDDFALDVNCSMIASAAVRVHCRRHELGDDSPGESGAMYPAKKPRVNVPCRKRKDGLFELLVNFRKRAFGYGDWRFPRGRDMAATRDADLPIARSRGRHLARNAPLRGSRPSPSGLERFQPNATSIYINCKLTGCGQLPAAPQIFQFL